MDTSTGIAALALSPDGHQLVSTSYSGGIQIWDTDVNNSQKYNIREFMPFAAKEPLLKGRMRGVSFYPDSSSVIVGSDDGTLEVWDYNIKNVLYRTNCHVGVRSLDVSPVDSKCAIGCKDGSIFLIPRIGLH